jgi:hypothetical protein
MPITNIQASFQNSRIKPRNATQTAETGNVTPIAIAGGAATLIRPANPNRTDLTIRNVGTFILRYGYVDRVSLNVDGFQLKPGEAFDITSPGDVFAVNEVGGPQGEVVWDEGSG